MALSSAGWDRTARRMGSVVQRAGDKGELRVAVVVADPFQRSSLIKALDGLSGIRVVAWADSLESFTVLGTRADVCICDEPMAAAHAARLRARGCRTLALDHASDPTDVVQRVLALKSGGDDGVAKPRLAPRQVEVLVAYVASSDLLPTIARRLGMDSETFKTHLRRVRAKYALAGRPAPTRRDLYVRAVEDGLLRPPEGHHWT
jgi:DNA-binding CsgD family transcriptional regulator